MPLDMSPTAVRPAQTPPSYSSETHAAADINQRPSHNGLPVSPYGLLLPPYPVKNISHAMAPQNSLHPPRSPYPHGAHVLRRKHAQQLGVCLSNICANAYHTQEFWERHDLDSRQTVREEV